ncbi:MAG: hypothetical protein IJK75_07475 [Bacteroidales bacterium]|nr:hypothetical protein [Bacteroidales bacterium]
MAPPPEYAVSGGWALRGATPQGLSSRPAKGTMGFPDKPGMTRATGESRAIGMTWSRSKPGMTGREMPERAGDDERNEDARTGRA